MSSISTLKKERARLKNELYNTPVVIKPTKYSYESNLVLKCGELRGIVEKLADFATDYAETMGD